LKDAYIIDEDQMKTELSNLKNEEKWADILIMHTSYG
jgi:hypothetical protein